LLLGCASAIAPAILESGYRLRVADGPVGKIVGVQIEAAIGMQAEAGAAKEVASKYLVAPWTGML